jgi:hypothetical protein
MGMDSANLVDTQLTYVVTLCQRFVAPCDHARIRPVSRRGERIWQPTAAAWYLGERVSEAEGPRRGITHAGACAIHRYRHRES